MNNEELKEYYLNHPNDLINVLNILEDEDEGEAQIQLRKLCRLDPQYCISLLQSSEEVYNFMLNSNDHTPLDIFIRGYEGMTCLLDPKNIHFTKDFIMNKGNNFLNSIKYFMLNDFCLPYYNNPAYAEILNLCLTQQDFNDRNILLNLFEKYGYLEKYQQYSLQKNQKSNYSKNNFFYDNLDCFVKLLKCEDDFYNLVLNQKSILKYHINLDIMVYLMRIEDTPEMEQLVLNFFEQELNNNMRLKLETVKRTNEIYNSENYKNIFQLALTQLCFHNSYMKYNLRKLIKDSDEEQLEQIKICLQNNSERFVEALQIYPNFCFFIEREDYCNDVLLNPKVIETIIANLPNEKIETMLLAKMTTNLDFFMAVYETDLFEPLSHLFNHFMIQHPEQVVEVIQTNSPLRDLFFNDSRFDEIFMANNVLHNIILFPSNQEVERFMLRKMRQNFTIAKASIDTVRNIGIKQHPLYNGIFLSDFINDFSFENGSELNDCF